LPPPPKVIHCFNVPRYVYTKLIRAKSARRQERIWEDEVRRRYSYQTVRTVCRIPRIYQLREARNLRHHTFESYSSVLANEEGEILRVGLAAMKLVLSNALTPRRVAGLGGLTQCQSCGSIGTSVGDIRHRNCLWSALTRHPT
jgi:hypothetical protein